MTNQRCLVGCEPCEHLGGQVFLLPRQIDVGTIDALVFLGPADEDDGMAVCMLVYILSSI